MKNLSGEELQAAFESIDIHKLLVEEFGDDMETAKSAELVLTSSLAANAGKNSNRSKSTSAGGSDKSAKPKIYDINLMNRELELLFKESRDLLPANITSQFTR